MQIKFGLSVREVKGAIAELRQLQAELKRKCELFARRLAEEGVILAQIKIMQYPAIYTGELLDSINAEPGSLLTNGSQWVIYTGCEWAPYVEFGTGIVGSENPHPESGLTNWKYDINAHGEAGWHYFKDGEWHWTKGMPSRPFMYETGKDLRALIPKIAREVFGNGRI
ncbi:MAG: hypothetical protein IJZ23_07985 [Roseburia sp.]|nr:hypothetical protein [Roseburia sp.]